MIDRVISLTFNVLNLIIALLLAAMVVMVFGNVVLRYAFNSGLSWSEELSRFCFVWLTFLGTIVTYREHSHLGVETLVQRLGRRGRSICMLLTNILVLICAGVFFWGTWQQAGVNASVTAPVVRISMIWVFGIGFVAAGGIGLIAFLRIVAQLLGRVTDEELSRFAGEFEDEARGLAQ
jgi:TRAP-type C4-dicarboxylate transport system permease small subunit